MSTPEGMTPEEINRQAAEDIPVLERRWQQAKSANDAEMISITQFGVTVDPGYLNKIRLDAFIAFIFARMGSVTDEIRQVLTLQFEIEAERRLAEQLTEIKADVRKADLGMGASVTPAQLRKMWYEQQKGNGGGSMPGGRG